MIFYSSFGPPAAPGFPVGHVAYPVANLPHPPDGYPTTLYSNRRHPDRHVTLNVIVNGRPRLGSAQLCGRTRPTLNSLDRRVSQIPYRYMLIISGTKMEQGHFLAVTILPSAQRRHGHPPPGVRPRVLCLGDAGRHDEMGKPTALTSL